ncbi:B12-binding domain-containing protein [Methanolobus sp. WCC5]|uniref:cobalamin B12-binding domain-containing protein n=1 Tax=Methanolobus sp. WCC5 TaxID=3125785 RepID=UPI00324C7373
MPSREQIIENAREAVLNLNEILAQDVAHDALESGIDPEDVIEYGFNAAMITIGDLFNQGKVFLPHMIAASEAMNAGIRVLVPENQENHHMGNVKGTVLIGTIEGDIHSIGKDIVATSLRIDGYEVLT